MKQLFFLIFEGFKYFSKFRANIISSILLISVTLFLFCGVISLFEIFDRSLNSLKGDLKIVVYLEDGLSLDSVDEILEKTEKYENVEKIEYRDKDKALREFKDMMKNGNTDELFSFLGENPIPASVIIQINRPENADPVIKRLKKEFSLKISEISFSGKTYERLSAITEIARMISTIILLILLFSSIGTIFISSAISINSRKEEIEIMQLVGATRSFIVLPFIFETIFVAVVSCIISIISIYFVKIFLISSLMKSLPVAVSLLSGIPSAKNMLIMTFLSIILCVTGVIISIRRNFR